MGSKHIAGSGTKAGQWVTCDAKQACRNGGQHITSEKLKEISEKTYTPIKDLTEADVDAYNAQNSAPAPETLLAKLMRIQPASTPANSTTTQDEVDAAVQEILTVSYLLDAQERLIDRHLLDNDSLTIWERRALFGKQRTQAITIFGNEHNFQIETDQEHRTLTFKSNSAETVERLVFYPDPTDPTKHLSLHTKKSYHQGQERSRTTTHYNSEGQLHGNGKPARTTESDEQQTTEYFENGQPHRDNDQPAKISQHEDGTTTLWYLTHGKKHRDGGKPAIIESNANTGHVKNHYYTNDEPQRTEESN